MIKLFDFSLALAICTALSCANGPAPSEGTNACGLHYGTSACASCTQARCCAESTSCAVDPACSAHESCVGACGGDPRCGAQCAADHPAGASSTVAALGACLAATCETECALPCGGVAADVSPPDSAAACQSCVEANACPVARACASSLGCQSYERCVEACSAEDCVQACKGQQPAGASAWTPLHRALTGTCAGPCAIGGDWSCAGHVSWPTNSLQHPRASR